MKTIFVSDVHIRGLKDPTMKKFLSFLEEEKKDLTHLIIGGDLLDFWIGIKGVVFQEYIPILNKLLELKEAGVQIDYIEGNHDFSLGSFFTDILKIQIIKNEHIFQIGNYHVYVAHGDQVNPKDYGYLFLRWFLRSFFVQAFIKVLPPAWIWWISQRSSHVSRTYRTPDQHTVELFRQFAKKKLIQVDVVILGHTHYPDEQRFENKMYFNTGDWIKNFTYLEFTEEEGFKLKTYA